MATPNMDKKKMMTTLIGLGISVSAAISGAYLTAPAEGWSNKTYLDPVGIATSCLGHTGPDVKLGKTYTEKECLDKFAKDLSKAEDAVDRQIHVPLTFYQKAALISFTFNVGENNLAKSTLAKDFNNKDYASGCSDLLDWVYAKKKKLPGLVARRQQEYKMCMGDLHVDND